MLNRLASAEDGRHRRHRVVVIVPHKKRPDSSAPLRNAPHSACAPREGRRCAFGQCSACALRVKLSHSPNVFALRLAPHTKRRIPRAVQRTSAHSLFGRTASKTGPAAAFERKRRPAAVGRESRPVELFSSTWAWSRLENRHMCTHTQAQHAHEFTHAHSRR